MTVERAMRQVLAEMTMLSYGSTTSWNHSGGSEGPGRPSGDSHPLAEHWRAEWERDPSWGTVERAREALAQVKRRDAPVVTDDSTLEDWIVSDGEGYAVAQVAGKFGIAQSRVRRIRLKAGRESEFGARVDARPVRDTSSERIRNLASQGCTERQIAFQVGVGKSTVRRALGRAA
jgi:hypothetical protein